MGYATFFYLPFSLNFSGVLKEIMEKSVRCISQSSREQFVIFKPLSYSFELTIGFDVNVSFASRLVSHLIR